MVIKCDSLTYFNFFSWYRNRIAWIAAKPRKPYDAIDEILCNFRLLLVIGTILVAPSYINVMNTVINVKGKRTNPRWYMGFVNIKMKNR